MILTDAFSKVTAMILLLTLLLNVTPSFGEGGLISGGGQLVVDQQNHFHFLDSVKKKDIANLRFLSFQDLTFLPVYEEVTPEALAVSFPTEFMAALKDARELTVSFLSKRPSCALTERRALLHLFLLERFATKAKGFSDELGGNSGPFEERVSFTDQSHLLPGNWQIPVASFHHHDILIDQYLFHLVPEKERAALLIHEAARFNQAWPTSRVEDFTRAFLGEVPKHFNKAFCGK